MTDKKQIIYEVKHLQKSFGNVEVLKDINIVSGSRLFKQQESLNYLR